MATLDTSQGGVISIGGTIGGVDISGQFTLPGGEDEIELDLDRDGDPDAVLNFGTAGGEPFDTKTIVIGLVIVAAIILIVK